MCKGEFGGRGIGVGVLQGITQQRGAEEEELCQAG
jgi:hypothetical protein